MVECPLGHLVVGSIRPCNILSLKKLIFSTSSTSIHIDLIVAENITLTHGLIFTTKVVLTFLIK